jgi:3-deoxy-manno-octulosonate cytidylyltransferase (CMP-KDO synthetase)
MNFIGIIPARYGSTRFPGKPLARIKGKSMIERVYEQSRKTLEHIYVATDDERIEKEVQGFGGNCIMTSSRHESGTDRLAEAIQTIEQEENKAYDVVINIQGDEPFIHPEQIRELCNCFKDPNVQIATLAKAINDPDDIFNSNLPKIITNIKGEAIYFSRAAVPHIRNKNESDWLTGYPFKKHLGMYGYRSQTLKEITRLKPSPLEIAESLEQNRWIEHGYKIQIRMTTYENHPVDTPGDLENMNDLLFE